MLGGADHKKSIDMPKIISLALLAICANAAAEPVVLLADRIIVGNSKSALNNAAIVVDGKKIVSVGSRDHLPDKSNCSRHVGSHGKRMDSGVFGGSKCSSPKRKCDAIRLVADCNVCLWPKADFQITAFPNV